MKNQQKKFLTYQEQVNLLKSKGLSIPNDDVAISVLKEYSYYSLISGYKDIFKLEKNGNYHKDVSINEIVALYTFDDCLRIIFLHEIIRIETHLKSLYSYSFCELYGDSQNDYTNVNNYNYEKYQKEINEYLGIITKTLNNPNKHKYITHNINKYGSVPLWIIIHTLTFGNLSKMFSFSKEKLQSIIAREFKDVYGNQLASMLNVLSKFRNVCAHGERLYNYKTQKSILDLPLHKQLEGYNPKSKNDLFNVLICFKYLSNKRNFISFTNTLEELINTASEILGETYTRKVLIEMGFPENWKDIVKLQ